MANTFSQIYLQVVFAVRGRENMLSKPIRTETFKYISGIIAEKGQKNIIVNGMGDHIHCLIGLKPTMNISDLVRDIKSSSSNFINSKNWIPGKFSWQEGYGVFSYSHSHLDKVYRYILDQENHHAKFNFKREYLGLLKKFDIPFEEKYAFDFY